MFNNKIITIIQTNMRNFYIVFIISALFSLPVSAEGVFTISNVQVSGSGNNAVEAKKNAIEAGEKKAFQRLLERITPSFTSHLWPNLEAEELSELVQSFEVEKEKVTQKHYEANLDITFNRVFVEKALQEAGVSYISEQTEEILLLPLLIKEDSNILWENNKWRETWKQSAKAGGFINFVIPRGDSEDKSYVDLDILASNKYPLEAKYKEGINKLLNKYKAKEILLAKAKYNDLAATKSVEVELVYLNEEYPERIARKFYANSESDNIDSVMKRASVDITAQMDKRWKKKLENSQLAESNVNVNIPIESLDQWNVFYKRLRGFSFIKNIETKYITVKYAAVDIHFQDGYEQLVNQLAAEGIYIESTDVGLFMKQYDTAPSWYGQSSESEYDEVDYEVER